MNKLPLFEIFTKAINMPLDHAVPYIQQFDSLPLRTLSELAFKPVEWDLPAGAPPYAPCRFEGLDYALYNETKRFYLFILGGSNIKQQRKQELFVQLLESVHPSDAALIIAIKDKNLPKDAAKKFSLAFPDLGIPYDEAVPEVVVETTVIAPVAPKKRTRTVKTMPAYDKVEQKNVQCLIEDYNANKDRYISINSAEYKAIKKAKETEVA